MRIRFTPAAAGSASLTGDSCAEVLSGMVNRARKFRLGVVSVSADLERFLVGGRFLFQNAVFRMAFGQDGLRAGWPSGRMAFGQDPALLMPVSEALGFSPGGREFLENASPCGGCWSTSRGVSSPGRRAQRWEAGRPGRFWAVPCGFARERRRRSVTPGPRGAGTPLCGV